MRNSKERQEITTKIGKSFIKVLICIFFVFIVFPIPFIGLATDLGGVTGAEFLNFSSLTRYNSMGMILDALGNFHEGLFLNQAVLVPINKPQIHASLSPLPNDVSYSQVSFDIPIYKGVGGFGVQFLNIGEFTYVNSSLQSEESMYIFDSAVTVGYGQYVYKSISAGGGTKLIYRSLGDYSAFALGFGVGGAYWFETPHVGQSPKPIPEKVLQRREESEKEKVDRRANSMVEEEKGKIDRINSEIELLEKHKTELEKKISEAKEEEKKNEYLKKLDGINLKIKELEKYLEKQKDNFRRRLEGIEEWRNKEISKISSKYSDIREDFMRVNSKRRKLFEVVDNPQMELEDKIIESTINDVISKTREYLKERLSSLANEKKNYEEKRKKRIDEMVKDIERYKKQIDEEFTPKILSKEREIAELEEKLAALPEKKNEEQKAMAKEFQFQLSKKKRELGALKNDPWYKRLNKRIDDKKEEIEEIKRDIEEKGEKIRKEVENLQKEIESEINYFQNLESFLKKELKKVKLKRELDLLKASNERGKKKALKEYEEKERNLYLKLLSVKFAHEKKIINSKIDSLRSSYNNRIFDIETQIEREMSMLEDEYEFQVKYETGKLKELERKKKELSSNAGTTKDAEIIEINKDKINKIEDEIQSIKKKLEKMEKMYEAKIEELESTRKSLLKQERINFENKLSELKWEMYLTKLLYLQTDTPYKNTAVNVALQNFGTRVKFVSEGYPLPAIFHASVGYGFLHTDDHLGILSFQLDIPFHDETSFGIGIEYAFLYTFFIRAGYRIRSDGNRLSFGTGIDTNVGFTHYSIEYTFQPVANYGTIHNFAISMRF